MKSLSDCLQVWGLEKDFIIFSDGSLGFALELTPVDISCATLDSLNHFSQRVSQFLNGLPSGISLQFVQEINSEKEEKILDHKNQAKDAKEKLAQELCHQRCDYLLEQNEQGFLSRPILRIFVRRPMSSKLIEKNILSFE